MRVPSKRAQSRKGSWRAGRYGRPRDSRHMSQIETIQAFAQPLCIRPEQSLPYCASLPFSLPTQGAIRYSFNSVFSTLGVGVGLFAMLLMATGLMSVFVVDEDDPVEDTPETDGDTDGLIDILSL